MEQKEGRECEVCGGLCGWVVIEWGTNLGLLTLGG